MQKIIVLASLIACISTQSMNNNIITIVNLNAHTVTQFDSKVLSTSEDQKFVVRYNPRSIIAEYYHRITPFSYQVTQATKNIKSKNKESEKISYACLFYSYANSKFVATPGMLDYHVVTALEEKINTYNNSIFDLNANLHFDVNFDDF